MSDCIKFRVPGKPEYIRVVRMGVSALACNVGFDVEAVDDIKLAVDEACKAITCHGANSWTNVYEVACEVYEDKMIISVSDLGDGRELEKQYRACKNCPQDGDFALILIKTLMNDVEIKGGSEEQKSIVMVKNK
ncbi:ATP-binding protein [Clostridium aminobutyricum]|uniref:ATP-binding protein n=1 Tax=Clostridium aminobutyricum TaxID=33953 RepID=A0A939D9T6_CLOAM|nr:ATP-binding protein [Clostridium aminobutyricum]MBN7773358.1 ATP-binding protein [Clostridium aminobutyricum]